MRMTAQGSMKRKDLDGDGELSLQEFWEGDVAMAETGQPRAEEEGTFKTLDADGNGRLSVEELMAWESGSHHTKVAMQELISVCDADADGLVTREELLAQHTKLAGTDSAYHFLEWAEHHEL
jgi:Ca2+-binding EF-hand superfamily protein